jgi:hypothetical protein
MILAEYLNIDVSKDLLLRALRARICPFCAMLQTRTHELLCHVQLEAVKDEPVNALVLSSGGYCHFHFWYLEKLASPVTNARLLEQLFDTLTQRNFEGSVELNTGAACPVCLSCRAWEETLLSILARQLQDKDFCAAYEISPGLCLPHLSAAVKKLPREQRAFLMQVGRRQLDVVIRDLKLLIEKWQTRNHTPGSESDAAFRAIAKLVGGRHCQTGG